MSNRSTARRFEELTTPHLDAAYNLARWLTQNSHDAEDVVQEAWLRAFRFFDGFHGDNARAWLLTIVRNTCYTWLQQNRRPEVIAVQDEDLHAIADAEAAHSDLGDTPENLLVRAADRALVTRALERLPTEFREILVLRELEDLSYKEIAGIADIPIGTVMSRLSRARGLLKSQIEQMAGGS